MNKVTGNTTLAELMVIRGKLGVTRMSLDFSYNGETLHQVRLSMFGPDDARVVATGETEIDTLDDGFSRLWHLEAAVLPHDVIRNLGKVRG